MDYWSVRGGQPLAGGKNWMIRSSLMSVTPHHSGHVTPLTHHSQHKHFSGGVLQPLLRMAELALIKFLQYLILLVIV